MKGKVCRKNLEQDNAIYGQDRYMTLSESSSVIFPGLKGTLKKHCSDERKWCSGSDLNARCTITDNLKVWVKTDHLY